jgi:Coenzyme PQQ synthesis protein D (PqqD)
MSMSVIAQLRAVIEQKKNRPSRMQVLTARPVRHPLIAWSREPTRQEGLPELVLVRVPRRQDRWGNFIAKWFKLPDDKKIELDQIGSDVWELCDGTHSVESIASRISKSYQLNKRQAEASVTAYLKMLADRRLIGLQTGTTKKK